MEKETFKSVRYREEPYDVDELDLENTLEEFLEQKDDIKGTSVWNIASVTGLVMLGVVFTMMLQVLIPLGPDLTEFAKVMNVVGAILIALTGFGWLAASKTRRPKKRPKTKAKSNLKMETQSKSRLSDMRTKSAGSSFEREAGERSGADAKVDPYGYREKKQLYRSRKDKFLSGVCSGIADYFSIDATFVRLVFFVGMFLYFSTFWVYVILSFVLPKEPKNEGF